MPPRTLMGVNKVVCSIRANESHHSTKMKLVQGRAGQKMGTAFQGCSHFTKGMA
jgi:hypothetical protein